MMNRWNAWQYLFAGRRRAPGNTARCPAQRARPALEPLEDRVLLSSPRAVRVENPIWTSNGQLTSRREIYDAAGNLVGVQGDGICQSRGGKHAGIDILANEGDLVRAPAAGRVVFVRHNWKPGQNAAGNAVVLEHRGPDGNLYYSKYFHLKGNDPVLRKLKKLAQTKGLLKKGAILGHVGRTGNVVPGGDTHLHFEIRRGKINGAVVCPNVGPGRSAVTRPINRLDWRLYGQQCLDPIFTNPDFCSSYSGEYELGSFSSLAEAQQAAQDWRDRGFRITRIDGPV